MKKLSYWARENKRSARLIIVFSFILMTVLGLITGGLLTDLNYKIPYEGYLATVIIYCCVVLIYPSVANKNKWHAAFFYFQQKSCDFLLGAVTFLLMIYVGNHPENLLKYIPSVNASAISVSIVPKDSSVKFYKSIKEFSSTMKDEHGKTLKLKERKKLLKVQIRAIKKSDETTKGGKGWLILLSALVAIGLMSLIAVFSCNLYCSGSEAAGVLLGIGGMGLILILAAYFSKYIQKKQREKKKEKIE